MTNRYVRCYKLPLNELHTVYRTVTDKTVSKEKDTLRVSISAGLLEKFLQLSMELSLEANSDLVHLWRYYLDQKEFISTIVEKSPVAAWFTTNQLVLHGHPASKFLLIRSPGTSSFIYTVHLCPVKKPPRGTNSPYPTRNTSLRNWRSILALKKFMYPTVTGS